MSNQANGCHGRLRSTTAYAKNSTDVDRHCRLPGRHSGNLRPG